MSTNMDFSHDLIIKCGTIQKPTELNHSLYRPLKQKNPLAFPLPTLRDLGIHKFIVDAPKKFTEVNYSNNSSLCTYNDELASDETRSLNPYRRRISKHQRDILDQVFWQFFFPATELRKRLAKELNMTPRAVQIWFQNKRQSWRAKNRSKGQILPNSQYIYASINPSSKIHNNISYPYNHNSIKNEPSIAIFHIKHSFNIGENQFNKKTHVE